MRRSNGGYWEVGLWRDSGGRKSRKQFWDWFCWIPARLAATKEEAVEIGKRYSQMEGRFTARKRSCPTIRIKKTTYMAREWTLTG